jgi:cell division protein FtsZ
LVGSQLSTFLTSASYTWRGSSGTSGDLSIKSPILVVGIGGAGSRLAREAVASIGCECLLVSNDKKDLGDEKSIFINTGAWVNPSGQKLRSFLNAKGDQLKLAVGGYGTVIVISNLAGRAGAAMAPLVCSAAKKGSTVISFAIMPFGFEKDRVFAAGVALRRVREHSDSTVVMDNDAFLENNPELSKEECYSLTNSAVVEVASSVASKGVGSDLNILCTSVLQRDSQESLRDSASMLYRDVAGTEPIKRTILYVMGGDKAPIGSLNEIVNCARGIFREEGTTEVAMSSMAATDGVRVHLVASAPQKTRFDAYDPLGDLIPLESHLDWDEPDSAPEIELAIPVMDQ